MELFAREFGQGSPVFILHGLFGFSDNWQTIAKGLAEQHLVITPDLRNHGRSPHASSHTYAEMAEDLHTYMVQHWIFSADYIGHSMGGKAAMQLALHYPDLVNRLVVVDMEPGPAEDNHTPIFKALQGIDFQKVQSRQEIEAYLAPLIPDYGTRQFLLKNITRSEDGGFAWKMNLPVLWQYFDAILAPVQGEPFLKPALFVRGGKSNYIRDSEIPGIKALFPAAEIVTIEDAGHWVHADQPSELLDVLRNFLHN
ncbi:MAG: alpha/beta fold hydrolase [Bacteroidetes bacterium]|nr:alpha/beta fold hydrolase [Bacteroidota bacterium]